MMDGDSENQNMVNETLKETTRVDIAQILDAHQGEQHVVFLQDFPDPDAISSAFAHQIISAEFDIAVDIVYGGRISHMQNVALVKSVVSATLKS
jgi:nanoRNase/pAp phosphatase (c-di-AMP/oligoRNAs hydrolase)